MTKDHPMTDEMKASEMTLVERLRTPIVIEYAVPFPAAEAIQRAADERGEAATLLEQAEAALQFYASEWNEVGVCVDSVKAPTWNLERDAGQKARTTLAKLREGISHDR